MKEGYRERKREAEEDMKEGYRERKREAEEERGEGGIKGGSRSETVHQRGMWKKKRHALWE